MRNLELLLFVTIALQILILLFQGKSHHRKGGSAVVILTGVTLTQYFVEGPRWQMYFCYGLVIVLIIAFLFRYSQKRFYLVRQPRNGNRSLKKSLFLVILGGLWFLALLPVLYFPVFNLPEPLGINPVGMVTFDFVRPKSGKIDPAVLPAESERRLNAKVLYPRKNQPGAEFGVYLKGKEGFFNHLKYTKTHSVENAPLADLENIPVVVFSHEYFGLLEQNTQWAQELASQGFVVFLIGRPTESLSYANAQNQILSWTQKTESKVIASLRGFPLTRFSSETDEQKEKMLQVYWANQKDLIESSEIWEKDLSWVIGELNRIQTGETSSIFTKKLDLTKIVLAGHGFGGTISSLVCELENSCAASINLGGFGLGSSLQNGFQKPTLAIYGKKLAPLFDFLRKKSTKDFFAVEVQNVELWDFTDLKWAAPRLIGQGLLGTISGNRLQTTLNGYSLSFLKAILYGSEEALLEKKSILGAILHKGKAASMIPATVDLELEPVSP
ncbi:MAG: hypothetical protein QNL04_02390 [SAR324 cluster bacterium]|nr:hypothetical protein [SAR324 cluster bacterium]